MHFLHENKLILLGTNALPSFAQHRPLLSIVLA